MTIRIVIIIIIIIRSLFMKHGDLVAVILVVHNPVVLTDINSKIYKSINQSINLYYARRQHRNT